MKKKRICLITISALLIYIGLLIYLCFNRTAFVSKSVNQFIELPQLDYNDDLFVKIIRNYGADFLWASSFVLIIQSILYLQNKMVWWLLLCAILGILFEVAQLLGIVGGTPDIIDVFIYILGTLLGILIIRRFCDEKMD